MAYSYVLYTGNGSTTQFSVPFGYISQEHVLATVAGSPVTFTWVNNSLIQMAAAPTAGAAVRVYRQTPLTEPLVDFTNGSTPVAADFDTNARQSIYTQQELDDSLVEGLAGVIPNGDKGDITTSVGGSVWTVDSGAITEAKVANGAITEAKVANGAVTTAKLANVIAPTVSSLNGGPLAGMRNLLINGNPTINQRGYVSGTVTSGANQYTLDRWRVVTSGQSITFTDSANVCTVTAPAGGIEQVIEGLNILSGTYVLNWTGTATATVNGTSVAKGGTVTLTGGTNCTVRFSGGTFSLPQLEPGTVATPFERRSYGQELALCQRYFCKTFGQSVQPAQNTGNFNGALTNLAGSSAFTGNAIVNWRYPIQMRATPSIFLYTPGTNTSFTACFTDSGGSYVAATATNIGDTACMIYSSGGAASSNSYAHIQAAASIEL
jgi:hypothetical protein